MLVFTVDLVEAGLVVRRTVAEEGTNLGVVEDKSFSTEEAGAEVNVHRTLRAFSFAPVTDAGSPDAGATVVNFGGAAFTHAAGLIHDLSLIHISLFLGTGCPSGHPLSATLSVPVLWNVCVVVRLSR